MLYYYVYLTYMCVWSVTHQIIYLYFVDIMAYEF